MIEGLSNMIGTTHRRRLHPSAYATPKSPRAHLWRQLLGRGRWRTTLSALGLFSLFALVLALVQFATPDLAGNDGYYHIRMAYLLRTAGPKPAFNWLPLTILNATEFVDHHFLFHVLLIPFSFGDLRLGAKIASVIFPALTFLSVWWLLRGQRVPYPGLWSIGLLIVSEAFIYRMSMARAQSLSLGVLVLALHWLLTGRHRRLLPLAFLYVWLYNAFPMLMLIAGAYVAARWMVDRRLEWRPLAYTGLGLGLGVIINPYFPANLLFIYHHLGAKIFDPTAIKVGSEWYPYDTTQLAENSGLALVAFVAGIVALGLHSRRMRTNTASSLFVTMVFGTMLFKSRRFVEYFPAFALIFCAMAWSPLVRDWLERKATTAGAHRHAAGGSSRNRGRGLERMDQRLILVGLMVLALLAGIYFNLGPSRHSLQRSKPYQLFAGAADWLQANTPFASRVFQTDWDDFPRLFFYNTHNTYTLGLDPTYMQLHDADLYELWVDISKGRVEHPSLSIARQFGAAYVVTDLKHNGFLRKAADDPGLLEVYRDDDAAVFQLVVDTSDKER